MTTTIAIAGKGGTGKTTVAALLVKQLVEARAGSILAVDADPSANLHLALGLPLEGTIGEVREEMLSLVQTGTFPTGLSKHDYLSLKIYESLVEGDDFDLLAMGRPEGPGCYCAANHVLRLCVDRLMASYDYLVMDNEAGLEHLSRRTTRDVDLLLIVSDPTLRGLGAARRIVDLVAKLRTRVAQTCLVVNRVMGPLPSPLQAAIDALGVPCLGLLSHDPLVAEADALGRPLFELGEESAVYRQIGAMLLSEYTARVSRQAPGVSETPGAWRVTDSSALYPPVTPA